MTKRRIRILTSFFLGLVLLFSAISLSSVYAQKDDFCVAYLEGDPYLNYAGTLHGLAKGLSEQQVLDVTDTLTFPEGSDDARSVWNWMSDHAKNDVVFDSAEFYQLIEMSDEQKTEFVRHMNEDADVDLILVMGTAAAKFVRQSGITTDIMVMSVTNAYASGIVSGIDYSGTDSVWAHTSPNRYINQLRVFHSLFPFERLGIVYENSENGRNEISYTDLKAFASDHKITLVEEAVFADQKTDGEEQYEQKMMEGYHRLAGRVDAVYMTNCGFRTPEKIPQYLAPLYAQGIPVFSQTGKSDVASGALMTIVRAGFDEIGSFCAERFVQIRNGEEPGSLLQEYDESQAICLNMAAADRADLKIPFKVLLSADQIITEDGELQ